MPNLSVPTVEVAESFRAAMAEFTAEGRGALLVTGVWQTMLGVAKMF